MTNRNPVLVILFSILSCGIYAIYWMVKTKVEMNNRGAKIPTAWLIIVPIANWYWMYKWSEGVQIVTNGQQNAILLFVLYIIFSPATMFIAQDAFNKLGGAADPAMATADGQPVPQQPMQQQAAPQPSPAQDQPAAEQPQPFPPQQ